MSSSRQVYHAYRNNAGVRWYLFFDSIAGPYITFSLENGTQRIYFGNEYLEQDWLYLSDYDRWIVVPSMPLHGLEHELVFMAQKSLPYWWDKVRPRDDLDVIRRGGVSMDRVHEAIYVAVIDLLLRLRDRLRLEPLGTIQQFSVLQKSHVLRSFLWLRHFHHVTNSDYEDYVYGEVASSIMLWAMREWEMSEHEHVLPADAMVTFLWNTVDWKWLDLKEKLFDQRGCFWWRVHCGVEI